MKCQKNFIFYRSIIYTLKKDRLVFTYIQARNFILILVSGIYLNIVFNEMSKSCGKALSHFLCRFIKILLLNYFTIKQVKIIIKMFYKQLAIILWKVIWKILMTLLIQIKLLLCALLCILILRWLLLLQLLLRLLCDIIRCFLGYRWYNNT